MHRLGAWFAAILAGAVILGVVGAFAIALLVPVVPVYSESSEVSVTKNATTGDGACALIVVDGTVTADVRGPLLMWVMEPHVSSMSWEDLYVLVVPEDETCPGTTVGELEVELRGVGTDTGVGVGVAGGAGFVAEDVVTVEIDAPLEDGDLACLELSIGLSLASGGVESGAEIPEGPERVCVPVD